jgi:hypothetical protein
MNPFEKLIQGGYTPTNTRVSSAPVGGLCRPPRKKKSQTATRKSQPPGETNTRVSSGPPPRGSDDPTKGRLDRPFAVLGLQKLLESSEEEAP